jgi:hypothetical protein
VIEESSKARASYLERHIGHEVANAQLDEDDDVLGQDEDVATSGLIIRENAHLEADQSAVGDHCDVGHCIAKGKTTSGKQSGLQQTRS